MEGLTCGMHQPETQRLTVDWLWFWFLVLNSVGGSSLGVALRSPAWSITDHMRLVLFQRLSLKRLKMDMQWPDA